MKHLLLVIGLFAVATVAFAQPNIAPPAAQYTPRYKATEDNLEAIALMGTFYNAVAHAQSYQGHFTLIKARMEEGQKVSFKKMDWKAEWTSQHSGHYDQLRSESVFTQSMNGHTSTVGLVDVEKGEQHLSFSPTRNVWSQRPRDLRNSDEAQMIVQTAWMVTLHEYDRGATFEIKEGFGTEPPSITASTIDGNCELVFDKATGNLRSWTLKTTNGEVTELRFLALKLNKPIPAATFTLDIPKSAKEVPANDMRASFNF